MNDTRPFLIIDDEPEMCWALENILRQNGYPSQKAFNAQNAMILVEHQPFRMVFLDAKLPDTDGLDLAQQLRESEPLLPVVIVSGYFYQDDLTIKEALKSGLISAFVGKPFVNDEIMRVIELHASR